MKQSTHDWQLNSFRITETLETLPLPHLTDSWNLKDYTLTDFPAKGLVIISGAQYLTIAAICYSSPNSHMLLFPKLLPQFGKHTPVQYELCTCAQSKLYKDMVLGLEMKNLEDPNPHSTPL